METPDVFDPTGLAVVCPGCAGRLRWAADRLDCSGCGGAGRRLREGLIDFTCADPVGLKALLRWPADHLDQVRAGLAALGAGEELPPRVRDGLHAEGVIDQDACLTDFGRKLNWSFRSEEWQQGDELQECLDRAGLDASNGGSVLDVGCNTGKAIRRFAATHPVPCAGVDLDLIALSLGCRVAERQQSPVLLLGASAYSLPFPDWTFSLVVCRNALTYMHQRRALREMIRVLRPGGTLFLRFENVRYDLHRLCELLARRASLRELACGSRDFLLGVVHHACGWQPASDGRVPLFRFGRGFASVRRVASLTRGLNCELTHVEESRSCPRFLGGATQTSVTVRKSK